MCIISISAIGCDIPDEATRATMWHNNPDGAGFMYAMHNKVHIHKGFMTLKALETALAELPFNPKDVPFMLHFRIGTHGGNIPENTHPFPITRKVKDMQALEYTCNEAFMHNGIIHSVEMSKQNISDTMEYDRQILEPLRRLDKEFYKNPALQILIAESINGSRMVFLNGKGDIERIGEWVIDEGIVYSNSTYKDYKVKKTSSKYGYWGYDTSMYRLDEDKKTLYTIPDEVYARLFSDEEGNNVYMVDEGVLADEEGLAYRYSYELDAYVLDYDIDLIDGNYQCWRPNKKECEGRRVTVYDYY